MLFESVAVRLLTRLFPVTIRGGLYLSGLA